MKTEKSPSLFSMCGTHWWHIIIIVVVSVGSLHSSAYRKEKIKSLCV